MTEYRNLILTAGTYEGSTVSSIIVGCSHSFTTAEEGAAHLRSCLMLCVKQDFEEQEYSRCLKCESEKTTYGLGRYCSFCGRSTSRVESNVTDGRVAAKFRNWFELESHEFVDWELLSQNGWQVGWPVSGPYLMISGFDGILEEWEDPDVQEEGPDKHLGRWWNSELLHEGEFKIKE